MRATRITCADFRRRGAVAMTQHDQSRDRPGAGCRGGARVHRGLPSARSPEAGVAAGLERRPGFPSHSPEAMHCRYVTRIAARGTRIRAELSDPYPSGATTSFHVQSAGVELSAGSMVSATSPGPQLPLTFGSATSVTVGARAQVTSDPLPLQVSAGQNLIVDLQVDAGDAPTTVVTAEHTLCRGLTDGTTTVDVPVRWLSGLLVDGPAVPSVTALGDSITEGTAVPTGAYERWTDYLAAAGSDVTNRGVSGGAISRPGLYHSLDGLTRLRSLVTEPGLTDVMIELGTNDLGIGVSPLGVLVALDQALTIDRSHGLATEIATILPKGVGGLPQEQARQAINAVLRGSWLTSRTGTLVDLDAALRDRTAPSRLAPAFDSGDHLHPNAAGNRQIARTVALALKLPLPR